MRPSVLMCTSPNSMAFPIAAFGLIAAGLKITLANSAYIPTELAHQLRDSRAGLVFVHPALLPVLLQAFKLLGVTSEEELRARVVINSFTESDEKIEAETKIERKWTRLQELINHLSALHEERKAVGDAAKQTTLLCYSSGEGSSLPSPSHVH